MATARATLLAVIAALALAASRAHAEPSATLRIATVAPDGTSWARELHAWARDTEAATDGKLRIKIYFGGIAGSEEEVLKRIHREQLDGAIGSELCTRLAPSLKVARVVGLFQTREENTYVLSRLKPTLDDEFRRAGFINLGDAGLGPEVLLSKAPVPDLATMRRMRWWVWSSDEVMPGQARALGLTVVQTPLDAAGPAFDRGAFDGLVTIPTAALAFQWTTQARYITALRLSFRSGCTLIAARAFDALPSETQAAIWANAGKLNQRIEATGRREDDALLGGLLSKQGLRVVAPSEQLRSEFFDAARAMRPGTRVASDEVMQRVLGWLADFRAEHGRTR